MKLLEPVDDGRCFGCGSLSETGLRMRFRQLEPGAVECRVTLAQTLQGWRGAAHGGIVALLLDEGMAHAAASRGLLGVTAELRLRFRAPIPLGEPLLVSGNVRWQRGDVLGVTSDVRDAEQRVLASGEGKFVSRGPLPPGGRLGMSDAE